MFLSIRSSIATLAFPAVFAALANAGDVLMVGPGHPFSNVAAAVTAANDGDVVVVEATSQVSVVIDSKSITVVSEALPKPRLAKLSIRGLGASQQVTIRGFEFVSPSLVPPTAPATTIEIEDCEGPVRLEACETQPALNDFVDTSVGVRVTDSLDVVLTRCLIRGGTGWYGADTFPGGYPAQPGGAAVRIAGSRVVIDGGTLRGGAGGLYIVQNDEYAWSGCAGAPAVRLLNGEVRISGCLLEAGNAGPFTCSNSIFGDVCGAVGKGGDCVENLSGGVVLLDDNTVPGSPKGRVSSNPVLALTGEARALAAPTIVEAPSSTNLLYAGALGDAAIAFGSLHAAHANLPPLIGTVLIGDPIVLGPIVLPAVTDPILPVFATFAIPSISPAAEGLAVHFQAGTIDAASNRLYASTTTVMTIVAGP